MLLSVSWTLLYNKSHSLMLVRNESVIIRQHSRKGYAMTLLKSLLSLSFEVY